MGINMSLSLGSFHGAPNVTLWPFQQFAQENFLEILSSFFIQSDGRPVPTFCSRFGKKNQIDFISQSQILKTTNLNDLNNLKQFSSVYACIMMIRNIQFNYNYEDNSYFHQVFFKYQGKKYTECLKFCSTAKIPQGSNPGAFFGLYLKGHALTRRRLLEWRMETIWNT